MTDFDVSAVLSTSLQAPRRSSGTHAERHAGPPPDVAGGRAFARPVAHPGYGCSPQCRAFAFMPASPRHCERSEAIQCRACRLDWVVASAPRNDGLSYFRRSLNVIASAGDCVRRSFSEGGSNPGPQARLDCFVARAPRNDELRSLLCEAQQSIQGGLEAEAVTRLLVAIKRRITPEPAIGPRVARTRWAPIRPN